MNPFELDGQIYLLSPRATTQWVRNLRLYVDRWAWEVKGFLDVEADASDDELRGIAPQHPAFRIAFDD